MTADALKAYAARPKGLRNPAIKEFVENVLQNAANPDIRDEDFLPYVLHQSRSIEIRVEPYTNAPVKGIVTIPLEDPSMDSVRTELALAITRVMRAAYRDATLKVVVEQQPG